MKVSCLRLKSPSDKGPSSVKLFANMLDSFDFSSAADTPPHAKFSLEEGKDEEELRLMGTPAFTKFQAVSSLTLYVNENHEGGDETVIDRIVVMGWPLDFKSGDSDQTQAQKESLQRSMGFS
eukprot:FR742546.1.p1 GENE.FR742546.1~~FR742546.1.p1  ORF type:complete len:141 (+),score=17.46 FR742546.1:58-423(+)